MPFVPSDESNSKKSVILWIHGGGYLGGQGMAYDGSYLAGIGNVIVVAINYRLEAFGFFSTGDDVAPGNYGLWDQKMAIQWVHDNIDSFVGDANSITLAGESAGGFSVALQALHPSNKGLFHRVIAQSGVSNSMTTFDNARSTAKLISKSLNCSTDLNSETMMCIRGKSFDDIHDAFMALPTRLPGSLDIHVALTLAPVVDGVFLKDSAENILMGDSSGSLDFFKSLDVIIGTCEAEGILLPFGYMMPVLNQLPFNLMEGIPSEFLCEHVVPPLVRDYVKNKTNLIPDICQKYASNGTLQDGENNGINLVGDVLFYTQAVQSLNVHASGKQSGKHFQYSFKRLSMYSKMLQTILPWIDGAGHGAEIQFLFPPNPAEYNLTVTDVSVAAVVMEYWANFAKTGYVFIYTIGSESHLNE